MIEVPEKTDAELLKQYQLDKNPSSLNILFSRYLDVGFRTAMRYMRNQSDAEDVLQLAFIQFLNNLHHFREDATSIKPWLMKMIVNTSIKKLREEKNRASRQQIVASERFTEYSANENSVEKENDTEALKIKIKTVVDTLPEKYRSPIWLVLYEGFSYPEVATVLALPEKTVRTQVSRGLERLKELLGSFGSVLSVDAISMLMIQSTLESAPATAKKIIDSKELYQSIGSKVTSQSSRLFVAKQSVFSLKLLAIISCAFFASMGAFFVVKHQKNKENFNETSKAVSLVPENTTKNEFNKTWDFKNIKDRNLSFSLGKWEWSESLQGMVTPINKGVIINLPIIAKDQIIVIESLTFPRAPVQPAKPLLLFNSACWIKDNILLGHEEYVNPVFYDLYHNEAVVQRTYFYNNYICSFSNATLIRCDSYNDISDAKLGLFTVNFVFKKITCRTISNPPAELLKAIEIGKKNSQSTKEAWEINDSEISLKNQKNKN